MGSSGRPGDGEVACEYLSLAVDGNAPDQETGTLCGICVNRTTTLALPCCAARICSECVTAHAAASGLWFKCAYCADASPNFIAFARRLGAVIVETLPNYIENEPRSAPPSCAAAACLCPKGASYDVSDAMPLRGRADASWWLEPCRPVCQHMCHYTCQ